MSNVAMLYHGNNEELHPAHRGFAESINADILSISNTSPHSVTSFYQEFSRGFHAGDYEVIIAEGSRPLYSGLSHKINHGSKLIYLCADHRLYELWNNTVEVDSVYNLFKYVAGTYGKSAVRTVAQHSIDGIIAVSDYVKKYLDPIFQERVPTQIAHPYIQSEIFDRLRENCPNLNEKKALTVGRATRYKGVDLLVEAWPYVREFHPDAELHIVGNGHPESLEDTLGVTVHGFVDDIVDVYANASLYVQPSRVDPFPVTVLEALRSGLPTLVTESTGNRSEVMEITDELIAPASPSELSAAVSWYFSLSQERKQKFSDSARNRGMQFGPNKRKKIFREKFQKLITQC